MAEDLSPDTDGSMPTRDGMTADPALHAPPTDGSLALFADLYELTMLEAYHREGLCGQAVFSLYVRKLPARRNYLIACGLETVLDHLAGFGFSGADIAYLRSLATFSDPFLRRLPGFRFTGDVFAVPEGTPIFANEPILEVVAPIAEAQVVETFVMNQIHLQTVLASKAARVVEAAAGRPVIDFGARRMHGIDAAQKAARAFYIAGVAATSNVLAGKAYGIPVAGTMAHSYVQAHECERAAFRAFVASFPETVLLVDTYDTIAGVRNVIELARRMGDDFRVSAVRLDSGDLAGLALESRRLLDGAGLGAVRIFASGGLDEDRIAELIAAGAPIDGFGVGTRMGVSHDAPDLDIAYKLCSYAGRGRVKLSPGKPILPGRKQVFRAGAGGVATGDIIARDGEAVAGRPLLTCVMRAGRRTDPSPPSLDELRRGAREEIGWLPRHIRALAPAVPPYRVELSDALASYAEDVRQAAEGQVTQPEFEC